MTKNQKRAPKILILAQTPPPFHGQSVMLNELVKAKWKWCEKKFIRLDFSDSIENVGRFSIKKIFRLVKIIFRIYKESRRGKIGIISYPPAPAQRIPFYRDLIILAVARRLTKKIVFHFHASGFDNISKKFSRLESFLAKKIYSNPDAVIVIYNQKIREVKWIKPKKVFIVPNGVADHFIKKSARSSMIRILSVGQISKEKGLLANLDVSRRLKNKGVNFTWIYMGDWISKSTKKIAMKFIRDNCLENNIEFVGVKTGSKKWDEYSRSDIFCLLTKYECEIMPLTILEAMMMGKIVIATTRGAISIMIADKKTGFLVENKNPKKIVGIIREVSSNEKLANTISKSARESYKKNYTLSSHLRKIENIYKNI